MRTVWRRGLQLHTTPPPRRGTPPDQHDRRQTDAAVVSRRQVDRLPPKVWRGGHRGGSGAGRTGKSDYTRKEQQLCLLVRRQPVGDLLCGNSTKFVSGAAERG